MTRYSVQNLFVHTVQSGVVPTLIRPSTETKQCKYTVTDFDKKKKRRRRFPARRESVSIRPGWVSRSRIEGAVKSFEICFF